MTDTQAPAEAYPLAWPAGWERTPPHERRRSTFSVPPGRARDELVAEVKRLGGRSMVISTNAALRRDGLPYAGQKNPEDPGVAVYWLTRGNEWRVVACDRWRSVDENIRAVGLTLGALRGLERWGASGVLDRAFQGFKALPGGDTAAAPALRRPWPAVLGVEHLVGTLANDELLVIAETKFRKLAREMHPDAPTGNAEAFIELSDAIGQARKELAHG